MEDIGAGPPRSFRQLLDAVITIGADLDLLTAVSYTHLTLPTKA